MPLRIMHHPVQWLFCCLLAIGLLPVAVQAQSTPPALVLQATTLDGAPFELGKLKGQVVLIFYWSTQCAVCRSHLAELRANLSGWRGKSFALVTVNVDADKTDWRTYEEIVAQTHAVRPIAVWSGQASGQKLPLTLVLDSHGRVVARHEGRIAPEAWDAVADMLL
jgi:peroxiredoxin